MVADNRRDPPSHRSCRWTSIVSTLSTTRCLYRAAAECGLDLLRMRYRTECTPLSMYPTPRGDPSHRRWSRSRTRLVPALGRLEGYPMPFRLSPGREMYAM